MNKLAIVIAIGIAATGAALAVSATPATAASIQISRRGIACQQGYNEGQVWYAEDGGFYNVSPGWRTALCPANVDAGSYSETAWTMYVYDRNPSLDINCRRIAPGAGGGSHWGQEVSTQGADANYKALVLPMTGGGPTILCYVPPGGDAPAQRTGIVSYLQWVTTY